MVTARQAAAAIPLSAKIRVGPSDRRLPQSIEELSRTIAQIEPDHKGIPVLLRQYLRLGGRILAFNVDGEFGNVLDGLMVVDLRANRAGSARRGTWAVGDAGVPRVSRS